MNNRTTVGFAGGDWDKFRKFLTVVVGLAMIGLIPNKYGKMAGVALAISSLG
jgi:hypothetical protein